MSSVLISTDGDLTCVKAVGHFKNLSEDERKFIDLVYVQLRTFDEVALELGCKRAEVSLMNERLRESWKPVTAIRSLWQRKSVGGVFWDFHAWYTGAERKCYYCGITEVELEKIRSQDGFIKKHPTRGGLELDRRHPERPYADVNNLVLACYWCNNAKTDTFTEEEGKLIGAAISQIWKNRLHND